MEGGIRRRWWFSQLLTGVGLFALLTGACEMLARRWPSVAGALFGALFLVGMVWLAVLALRATERAADVSALSGLDRALIYWSGPLCLLLIALAALIARVSLEDQRGQMRFTSRWSLHLLEAVVASGFVLSLCCLRARPGTHVRPRRLWKVVCAPLLVAFGMYALLMPLSCAAVGVFPS